MMKALITIVGVVCFFSFHSVGAEPGTTMIDVEGGDVYTLKASEPLFSSDTFKWKTVPDGFKGFKAVRSELNSGTPLVVDTKEPGYLYAVLWRWDYGLLGHGPSPLNDLNGWELVDEAGAEIADAPKPFSSAPLYRLAIGSGKHSVNLVEYAGQWVIVGFRPDADAKITPVPESVTLTGAKTRHNVVDPGTTVVVKSEGKVIGVGLYHKGKLVLERESSQFKAPDQAGRYCLDIRFPNSHRVEPLTVGYGPVTEPGWPKGFFPRGFYGVTGASFSPNGKVMGQLSLLCQFELGSNTFISTPGREGPTPEQAQEGALLDLLGVRRIMRITGCRWPMRELKKMDDAGAVRIIMWEITHFGKLSRPNVLGAYVEDETPPQYSFRLAKVEEAFSELRKTQYPNRHLLYCLGGAGDWRDAVVWRIANSTVMMARAYPVRQGHRDSDESRHRQIKTELGDMITNFQKMKTDKGISFWLVPQVFGTDKRPPIWDPPTAEQIRLMVNLGLARGIKGVTYFGFGSTPRSGEDLFGITDYPYVASDDRYDEVAAVNAKIKSLEPLLTTWEWVTSVPQETEEFDVQILASAKDQRYAYVTNLSYLKNANGMVKLPDMEDPVEVSLEPGDGTIIEILKKSID